MGGLGGAQEAGGGKLYTTEMEFPINFRTRRLEVAATADVVEVDVVLGRT